MYTQIIESQMHDIQYEIEFGKMLMSGAFLLIVYFLLL